MGLGACWVLGSRERTLTIELGAHRWQARWPLWTLVMELFSWLSTPQSFDHPKPDDLASHNLLFVFSSDVLDFAELPGWGLGSAAAPTCGSARGLVLHWPRWPQRTLHDLPDQELASVTSASLGCGPWHIGQAA